MNHAMQADLAGREFDGEKGAGAVVISATQVVGNQLSAEEQAAVLAKHPYAMNIPRRPPWDRQTTGQQIQERERASFLEWRRKLARCATLNLSTSTDGWMTSSQCLSYCACAD
jgi:hypothetical protein